MASKNYEYMKRTDRGTLAKPYALYQGPNARTNFDPEELATLKEQIRQDGVKQPLIVKRVDNGKGGHLKIFDGDRRNRCVQELIAEGHDIEWVPVIVRQGSDAELMVEAAMTAVGKAGLDFIDETNLVRMLLGYGMSVADIATRLGKSTPWAYQRQSLIGLEPFAQTALRDKEVTLTKALKMAKLDSDQQREELDKVRERRANGAKKAGSVTAKPGKKRIREMAADMLREDRYYSAGQVEALLKWVMGETDEDHARKALKPLSKKTAERPADQPTR